MCRNEWVRGVCRKPQVKCGECPNQAFIPVGDDIIRAHLAGKASGNAADFTVGVYPMLPDETCWFLAADFDKKSWMQDVAAFRDTARAKGVPIAIERSRSGNGAHAWIFFAEPVLAADARRLGALLVTATMDRCPDIGFDSYDRFFPSQDTMPAGGFGNLIALPLQSWPRKNGNSVFLDDDFHPYEDQWAYLSTIGRLSRGELTSIVAEAAATGRIIGVRLPSTEEDDEPWAALPSRRNKEPPIEGELPDSVEVVLSNQVYIDRAKLPPVLVNRIARLAARNGSDEKPAIQELYAKLAQDAARNDLIFNDILSALEDGRSPVVITERKDHLDQLAARLSKFAKNVIVLRGGMSMRQSRTATEALATIPDDEERVLVATGRYLGEGFDDARLDTLFLTMPISWRGILAQYAGRLHRLHATKRDVVIYDYVDGNEPMLAKMAVKREAGYRSLGYRAVSSDELDLESTAVELR